MPWRSSHLYLQTFLFSHVWRGIPFRSQVVFRYSLVALSAEDPVKLSSTSSRATQQLVTLTSPRGVWCRMTNVQWRWVFLPTELFLCVRISQEDDETRTGTDDSSDVINVVGWWPDQSFDWGVQVNKKWIKVWTRKDDWLLCDFLTFKWKVKLFVHLIDVLISWSHSEDWSVNHDLLWYSLDRLWFVALPSCRGNKWISVTGPWFLLQTQRRLWTL